MGSAQLSRTRNRRSVLLLFVIVVAAVAGLIMPWAFHIGGRWTPLLTWQGSGTLMTKSGAGYPVFVSFHPSSTFSRLHLDGLRPTGGLSGTACLCTSPGTFEYLRLSGTIYGGWASTDGSVVNFRFLEPTLVDMGQGRGGYFDLIGHWHGPELVLDDRGAWSKSFRSGLRIEQASLTLRWNPFWTCSAACASATHSRSPTAVKD